MKEAWYKVSNKDKEARQKEVLSYRNAFDDLTEVLSKTHKKKEAVRDYGPGWAEKQIAVNEYNQAITDVLSLINLYPNTKE